MSKIIEYVRDFIKECPLLEGERLNVDYVGTQMSFSVDTLPCDPIIKRYVDGGAVKQYQFALTSKEEYDEDIPYGLPDMAQITARSRISTSRRSTACLAGSIHPADPFLVLPETLI